MKKKNRKKIQSICKYCNKNIGVLVENYKDSGNFCTSTCSNKYYNFGHKKGVKLSEETKRKLSLVLKGKGLGRKLTEETKKKISKANKGRHLYSKTEFKKGELHPSWKGGIHRDKHNGDWRYKEWRMKVFSRDNFTCQVCKKIGGYLEAHHIKKWSDYPDLRLDINNGITLCKECHKKTDSYGLRSKINSLCEY